MFDNFLRARDVALVAVIVGLVAIALWEGASWLVANVRMSIGGAP